MSPRRVLAMIALAGGLGCYIGPDIDTFALAQGPGGTIVTIDVHGIRARNEVIAVSDSAMLTVYEGRLAWVPWRLIDGLTVPHWRNIYTPRANGMDARSREALAQISRFPQGISPDIERGLLVSFRQTAIDVVR